MTVQLFVAPAATGKTAYVLSLVRETAQGLRAVPRVVVPTQLQVRALRRRLADSGGAIGVRVLNFDRLYAECLNASGEAYTELSEPMQYRLIRSILDQVELEHYRSLCGYPGFVQILQELFGELKAARVHPDAFARAVEGLGDEARLAELAQVYAGYQQRLQEQGWADRAGLGWLAVEALERRAPAVGRDWPLLVVDGFDSFTPIQVALLKTLANRVGEMVITLTGPADGQESRPVHRRFERARRTLEEALGAQAQPLPGQWASRSAALTRLEAGLYSGWQAESGQISAAEAGAAVEMIEAPDRASEVRAALRWLKARLVQDRLPIHDVALLARAIAPYYPFIVQTAEEFGLPVRPVDGLPLRSNPAIAALLALLRLMLPCSNDNPEPALPRRAVVEAWRSPYFDWSALPAEGATEPIGIVPGDADALDAVARWGRVIAGQAQWVEALQELVGRSRDSEGGAVELDYDERRGIPAGIPVGPAAEPLWARFRRFVRRLTPPPGPQTYRAFVQWLEGLIGPDPDLQSARYPVRDEPTALQMVACARAGQEAEAERDIAALAALKDVLRGLAWAEEAVAGARPIDYPRFLEELAGAIEATSYRLPIHVDREELLVADVTQARGLPFRAVAVLGLAEGEFPATLHEDPFLRDDDRRRLRSEFLLPLELSTESAEVEFFYEAITRPAERLLLTRPRLADNGALWQASPYWEEVRKLAQVEPRQLTSEAVLAPGEVASWPELMQSLAAHPGQGALRSWAAHAQPERQAALDRAAEVLRMRRGKEASALDGELSNLAGTFARQFGPDHDWSATRLETYRNCPFDFFVGTVLRLEPRSDPAEGLEAWQLGNIYHRILEKVYQAPGVDDPNDVQQLLAALPEVTNAVLGAAPQREGFRETKWWEQTRAEIVEHVRRSLQALAEISQHYQAYGYELRFGMKDQPPLLNRRGNDCLRLHGVIDRIDRAEDSRLRVIDYKTAGPSQFSRPNVRAGKKLQLPLYALAARDALGLGEPADGFYWHVQQAEASGFTLRTCDGGVCGAITTALEYAWQAALGARGGHFAPTPPRDGCPSYCPAAAFCWHLHPGYGG